MALTLLALAALTLAFGAAIALLLAWGLAWLTGAVGLAVPTPALVAVGAVATLVSGGVLLRRALRQDAAKTFDAERVGPGEFPALHATVTRLAQAADLPVPAVYVADRETPLAMTTGLSTDDAELVVSTGLLNALDDRELEAVVAHELAHVKNRDAAVMTLVELPLASARKLAHVLQSTAGVHFALVGVAIGSFLFWAGGRTLVASLSRSRELAADRGATALLGDPAPLASALETLAHDATTAPKLDAREEGLAALSVVPAPEDDPGPKLTWEKRRPIAWSIRHPVRRLRRYVTVNYLRPLRATHPPTDERIARLRRLSNDAAGP